MIKKTHSAKMLHEIILKISQNSPTNIFYKIEQNCVFDTRLQTYILEKMFSSNEWKEKSLKVSFSFLFIIWLIGLNLESICVENTTEHAIQYKSKNSLQIDST